MGAIIQEIREFEQRISNSKWDDETAHGLEDEAMSFFIKHCLEMSRDDILEAQEIFKRIENLNFCRWCA